VFAADFNRHAPLVFDAVAAGTVAPNAVTASEALTLEKAGVFQFALAAQGGAGDAVTMTVYDEDGNAVFALTATGGQPPATATKYLKAGAYTVRYTGAKANKGPAGYGLFLAQLSEGVGPVRDQYGPPAVEQFGLAPRVPPARPTARRSRRTPTAATRRASRRGTSTRTDAAVRSRLRPHPQFGLIRARRPAYTLRPLHGESLT
jgi:hypothetical protein